MTTADIQACIEKIEAAISATEKSISDAREKAAEIEAKFNQDCESLHAAYSAFKVSRSSEDYDTYAVIYGRLTEEKSRHDEIRKGFDRDRENLKRLRKSLEQYRKLSEYAEDESSSIV